MSDYKNPGDTFETVAGNLKASDLDGKAYELTISGWHVWDFDNGPKSILEFEEGEKNLVLNKTNYNRLEGMFGPDFSDWVGKKITLAAESVEYQGKVTQGIRVQLPVRVAEPGDDEIPF